MESYNTLVLRRDDLRDQTLGFQTVQSVHFYDHFQAISEADSVVFIDESSMAVTILKHRYAATPLQYTEPRIYNMFLSLYPRQKGISSQVLSRPEPEPEAVEGELSIDAYDVDGQMVPAPERPKGEMAEMAGGMSSSSFSSPIMKNVGKKSQFIPGK